MLYINDSPEILTDSEYNRWLPYLPAERRKKALSYINEDDSKRCVAAYILLVKGLKNEYGFSEFPEITYSENGKPFLKDYPNVYFNISHCDKAVACIISTRPIGIDVETIKPFDKELATFVCNKQELTEILNNPDPALLFTILWTRKESFCKMTGEGLNDSKSIKTLLEKVPVSLFKSQINSEKSYVITSCSE